MNIEEFKAIVGDIGTGEKQTLVPQQSNVPLVAETSALPEQDAQQEQQTVGSKIDVTEPDPFASIGFPSAAPVQEATEGEPSVETVTTDANPFASAGYSSPVSEPIGEQETTPQTNLIEQGASGINEGLANIFGLGGDLSAAATNLGAAGINALLGTDFATDTPALFGSQAIEDTILDPFISDVEPQTAAQRYIRSGGRAVGQAAVPIGGALTAGARPLRTGAQILASELGAETGAQVARDVAPDSVAAELVGSVLGAFAPTSAIRTSQRLTNIIGRIGNAGSSRDIASAKRIVDRIAKRSPDNVTADTIIEAIASDERLGQYMSDAISDPNMAATSINAAAGRSPNTMQRIRNSAVSGSVDPVTGEVRESVVRQQLDDVNRSVERLGSMTENALSNLTPGRLAEISKDISDAPGGKIYREQLVNKLKQFIVNDTEFLDAAGYPRSATNPTIIYNDDTGVPYLVKYKNGNIATPGENGEYAREDLVAVFNAPTLENAAGNILSSVRGEIDAMSLSNFREGRVADQQLAADVFAPASRNISQTIAESSPEFGDTSSRQRAARVAQEAIRGAARGEGTNALMTLRDQISRLDPNDPLLEVLDDITPSNTGLGLTDIERTVREADVLTRVGGDINPREFGVDYLNQLAMSAGQAIALGGRSTISNAAAGRNFIQAINRKNIPGAPSKSELLDADVIEYMMDLTSNRERFSEVFERLRRESTDRELEDAVNQFVAFFEGLESSIGDTQSLENELGAQ